MFEFLTKHFSRKSSSLTQNTFLFPQIRGLPLAPPELLFRAAESSLPDFLRSVHETQVLGCLAEADADDVDRFDFAIDR